ncbi:MAG: hypothetical protein M3O86_03185 [Actinomycetota bacterium]|nr:hypothetical protein [Actinomycetota bacterium]
MARERRNGPPSAGERVRRRLTASPEIELTDEELRALADEGIDPDDVRRLARERSDLQVASDHDRDTARDELEGLAMEHEDDY